MIPLNTILFIDDNRGDNYYHLVVMEEVGIKANIECFQYAEEALGFLKQAVPGTIDLIFLDINMPRMDGFEFLEHYCTLDHRLKAKGVIIMLTTSFNPADRERATKYAEVKGFYNKPLTSDTIREIIEENFSPDPI